MGETLDYYNENPEIEESEERLMSGRKIYRRLCKYHGGIIDYESNLVDYCDSSDCQKCNEETD